MNRPLELIRGAGDTFRERFAAIVGLSERNILLGTILLVTVASGAIGFVMTQYYSIDVLSSVLAHPYSDCFLDWGMSIGRHCFSDYTIVVGYGMRSNPWEVDMTYLETNPLLVYNNYPAAGMIPHMLFGLVGASISAPILGMAGYLVALTVAVLTPAIWAARGAIGLERILVFIACGSVAIPAWAVVDRGNSVGFIAPVALLFLIALCKQSWGLAAIAVVMAALVKPQFIVLALVLFAVRQWRMGGLAIAGALVANIAAYLLWPQNFPQTIAQSMRSVGGYGSGDALVEPSNVSFARGILLVPDMLVFLANGGKLSGDFLAVPRSVIGYMVLIVIVVAVLALGRRMPPVMAGILLLTAASLFPAVSNRYYLVFVLPIAAVIVRDPLGPRASGIFDRLASLSDRRRAVGICVSLAAALTIAQVALPHPPIPVPLPGDAGTTLMVFSTAMMAPILWLIACAVIIVSYARRPASDAQAPVESAAVDHAGTPTAATP